MRDKSQPREPTFSAVITCHNYAEYVSEAVVSALNQTHPVSKVVVVDDGSTDKSWEVLTTGFGSNKKVHLVRQENLGQLAALIAGFAHCESDVLCFLDADDVWDPGYIAHLAHAYQKRCADFVFTNLRLFGREDGFWHSPGPDRDLGYSILATFFNHAWYGSPTSAISLKSNLARSIFALPAHFYDDWRTRADDCVILASSILGARKLYLSDALVNYRVHSSNNFHNTKEDSEDRFLHSLRVRRLCRHFGTLRALGEEHRELAKLEFRTKPCPTRDELVAYIRIATRSRLNWRKRLEHSISMWRHYRMFTKE